MKIIVCDTPSGQYAIPLKLVAEHRAKYYSKVDEYEIGSDSYFAEVNFVMNDDYEGIDWLLNNTDWETWKKDAIKLNDVINVLKEDFWRDANNFHIINKVDGEWTK